MASSPCVRLLSVLVGPARMLLLQTPCPDALPDRPSLDHLGADRRTLADWVTEPALQPLVVRPRRCRIPLDLEVPPGAPRVWVLRLPSADTVRRTAQHREGLARLAHWGALARGWAAASFTRRPPPAYPYPSGLAVPLVCLRPDPALCSGDRGCCLPLSCVYASGEAGRLDSWAGGICSSGDRSLGAPPSARS